MVANDTQEGLLDNQTPAYHAHAVKLAAEQIWKVPADRMRFRFYPKLGHTLDPRESYDDLNTGRVDPEARKDVAKRLKAFF